MWDFLNSVNLIRYLIVWRVNSTLVRLPRYLPTELSQVIGTLIAERLPTQQAHDWRKALGLDAAASDTARQPPSALSPQPPVKEWPIESVLFAYPGKRAFGQGEIILWELKLLGNSADHGLFLEVILPALEAAASTTDPRWHQPRSLWGRFDIHAVYAARGAQWEPLVSEGRLNLDYRADPRQWAEGLTLGLKESSPFRRLTWLMPFDLGAPTSEPCASEENHPRPNAPTMQNIVDALMERMVLFLPAKRPTVEQVWARLSPKEQTDLWLALQETQPASAQGVALEPPPKGWPGRWIGTQTFKTISARLTPYLELASILHIGKQTHLGCGTLLLN
jgi:hypothetical protein